MIRSEHDAWHIISSLARAERSTVSDGLNDVLALKATNR